MSDSLQPHESKPPFVSNLQKLQQVNDCIEPEFPNLLEVIASILWVLIIIKKVHECKMFSDVTGV